MAFDTKNLVVGAGTLYIAEVGVALPTYPTDGASVKTVFESDAGWTNLGFTTDGVEVAYEPTYSDVNVDQVFDAARLFLESETFNFSTSLQEATLENLITAWGRNAGDALVVSAASKKFTVKASNPVPCEYQIAIVGPAPGSSQDCIDGDGTVLVERIYNAFRVVSVTGSTHSMQRTGETTFPVTFRALPYFADNPDGEYATIEDYNVTEADATP